MARQTYFAYLARLSLYYICRLAIAYSDMAVRKQQELSQTDTLKKFTARPIRQLQFRQLFGRAKLSTYLNTKIDTVLVDA